MQLQGLRGAGDRLDQREAFQPLLRGLDDAFQIDEKAVHHYANRNQRHHPQQRELLGVVQAIQHENGRGEDSLH